MPMHVTLPLHNQKRLFERFVTLGDHTQGLVHYINIIITYGQ